MSSGLMTLAWHKLQPASDRLASVTVQWIANEDNKRRRGGRPQTCKTPGDNISGIFADESHLK